MQSISNLLRALAEASVRFVLVGGFAVQLHGFVRSTIDLDLALAMVDANLRSFVEVARRLGLQPAIPAPLESLLDAAKLDEWHVQKRMLPFSLRDNVPGGVVIDILIRPEVSFEEMAQRAVPVELFGEPVRIAAVEDLITMKRHANRLKDRIDVEALEKIRRGKDPNA